MIRKCHIVKSFQYNEYCLGVVSDFFDTSGITQLVIISIID